jgi:thiol-disulfide isomerase/thioredoxin
MKREKGKGKRLLLFLVLLVLGFAVLAYIVTQPPEPVSLGPGDLAPDFELEVVGPNGLTGGTVKLSSFRGRVVVLEFMESWCSSCRWIAPAVESIRQDYEARGVVFISVAGTYGGANASSTAAFIREYQTRWTYGLDSDNKVFTRYNIEGTPTFFIIDRNGVIVSTYKGAGTTSQDLISALDVALER